MKTSERAEAERVEKLLAKIEAHPLAVRIREDEAAAILEKRREALGQIEALEAERAEAKPGLEASLARAEAGVEVARERLAAATDELRAAKHALVSKTNAIEGAIRQQREILHTCYDPRIDETITFFRDKLDELRKPGKISHNKTGALRNIFTWTKTATVESNEAAILAALGFCQDAIKALEEMKFAPAVDLAKIKTLKAGIPPIDVYQGMSAETPLPRL